MSAPVAHLKTVTVKACDVITIVTCFHRVSIQQSLNVEHLDRLGCHKASKIIESRSNDRLEGARY